MPDLQGKYTVGGKGVERGFGEATTPLFSSLSPRREAGIMLAIAAQRRLQPSGVHRPTPPTVLF